MALTTPLLKACQSCRSPPLDPDPPQALLLEQSPRCVRLLWGGSLGESWAASIVGYEWGHSGKLRLGGRWGLLEVCRGVEWRMGCVWEPCPGPPAHLWKGPVRCQFAMQISLLCRLTLWKGTSMASIKQASADGKCHSHFDSWPLFSKLGLILKKRKKKSLLLLLCASAATHSLFLDCHIRLHGEKEKTKFTVPIHIGAVIVIHSEMVWNTSG